MTMPFSCAKPAKNMLRALARAVLFLEVFFFYFFIFLAWGKAHG